MADLVICIVNYRTPDLTLGCLAALAEERALVPGMKAVVADGCSADDSADILAAALAHDDYRDWCEFVRLPLNGGFGWANNQVILRLLQSDKPPEFIHLLNPDAKIRPGAIKALYDKMLREPRCGAVGGRLINKRGQVEPSAFRNFRIRTELARGAQTHALLRLLGTKDIIFPPSERPHEAEWVSGASVALRAAALREAGLFDDSFFLYFEETELLWRFRRAGWSVWYEPRSIVEHHGGAATQLSHEASMLARTGRPFYWYESQKRLMFRTMTPLGAWCALGAWLIGRGLFGLRVITRTSRNRVAIKDETRDMLTAWLRGSKLDREPQPVSWNSPVGLPPAWMRAK